MAAAVGQDTARLATVKRATVRHAAVARPAVERAEVWRPAVERAASEQAADERDEAKGAEAKQAEVGRAEVSKEDAGSAPSRRHHRRHGVEEETPFSPRRRSFRCLEGDAALAERGDALTTQKGGRRPR